MRSRCMRWMLAAHRKPCPRILLECKLTSSPSDHSCSLGLLLTRTPAVQDVSGPRTLLSPGATRPPKRAIARILVAPESCQHDS
eukprot:1587547-Amphidinium_carterae.1